MTFAYATSHRIVERDGVLWKDLSDEGLLGEARWAKPPSLHDPGREPAVYRLLLTPAGIGPRCLDSGTDWIAIERLPGVPLWQIGDEAAWVSVATWLARTHRRLLEAAAAAPVRVPLLVHDRALYAGIEQRAAEAGIPARVLDEIRRAASEVMDHALGVIHGDCYPSNIIVGEHVWPVDWELAGWGSPLLDLAALTSGRLQPAIAEAMLTAYHREAGATRRWSQFTADVDACRLLVCAQWVGWSSRWTPPAEHSHDWMGEARRLAERRIRGRR